MLQTPGSVILVYVGTKGLTGFLAAKRSFKSEYMSFLRKFDIAFEEKYVFKFIDE